MFVASDMVLDVKFRHYQSFLLRCPSALICCVIGCVVAAFKHDIC